MRIDSMVLREDFYTILSDTVEEYYKTVFGKPATFTYDEFPDSERLVINENFGFVSRYRTPKCLKDFLLAEYNIRGNRAKNLAGKMLVHLVCAFPCAGKTRPAYISKGVFGKQVFISPQNRSVRFYDYSSMTVDCIAKKGFSNHFFKNQMTFRKNHHYEFMVPLNECGENWFREPILQGHPLARTIDQRMYEKGMRDAQDAMQKLAHSTLEMIPASDYADTLRSKIDELLSVAENRKNIDHVKRIRRIAGYAIRALKESKIKIPIVMSHGDLQSGNIWIDQGGKTIIYDWETVGKRSIWYDPVVLIYSLRRDYGWEEFLRDPKMSKLHHRDYYELDSISDYVVKNTVLLEDLIFYMEDMDELSEDWGSDIFNGYVRRLVRTLEDGIRIPK